ncbi:MAG: hypothetical protein HZA52_00730 [Planctomycetes bacterium]|nr:hypothetical protein [Planctomycetota bacterium]
MELVVLARDDLDADRTGSVAALALAAAAAATTTATIAAFAFVSGARGARGARSRGGARSVGPGVSAIGRIFLGVRVTRRDGLGTGARGRRSRRIAQSLGLAGFPVAATTAATTATTTAAAIARQRIGREVRIEREEPAIRGAVACVGIARRIRDVHGRRELVIVVRERRCHRARGRGRALVARARLGIGCVRARFAGAATASAATTATTARAVARAAGRVWARFGDVERREIVFGERRLDRGVVSVREPGRLGTVARARRVGRVRERVFGARRLGGCGIATATAAAAATTTTAAAVVTFGACGAIAAFGAVAAFATLGGPGGFGGSVGTRIGGVGRRSRSELGVAVSRGIGCRTLRPAAREGARGGFGGFGGERKAASIRGAEAGSGFEIRARVGARGELVHHDGSDRSCREHADDVAAICWAGTRRASGAHGLCESTPCSRALQDENVRGGAGVLGRWLRVQEAEARIARDSRAERRRTDGVARGARSMRRGKGVRIVTRRGGHAPKSGHDGSG